MTSVASAGTAERIVKRILLKVVRAGSGTLAIYSSTSFGATLAFAMERRSPDFFFFIVASLAQPRLAVPLICAWECFANGVTLGRPCEPARRQNFRRRWKGLWRPCNGDSWRAGRDGEWCDSCRLAGRRLREA